MAELAEVQQRIRDRSPLTAARTEEIIKARFSGIPNRLRFALAHWPLASSRVLDVGCAYGNTLAFFGEGSFGIDIIPEHVEFCRAIGLAAEVVDAERGQDQIPDGRFEYAWVCDVLEHLDAPNTTLRGLADKLTDDGRLLVYITALPRSRVLRAVIDRRGPSAYASKTHYYQFTRDTAQFMLERAGYRVVSANVPLLGGRWEAASRLVEHNAPTLIFEAVPDRDLQAEMRAADQKNHHGANRAAQPAG